MTDKESKIFNWLIILLNQIIFVLKKNDPKEIKELIEILKIEIEKLYEIMEVQNEKSKTN